MSVNSINKLSTISTAFLTTALVSYAGSASAFTLNGTSGSWSNVVGTTGTFQQVGAESQVLWGAPATPGGQSGLAFTGVGASELELNQLFRLGALRHFNTPISSGTGASAVDLSIDVDLAGLGVKTFDFTLGILETPNVATDCPQFSENPCPDRISINNLFAQKTFSQGGMKYALKLNGLKIIQGNNATSGWTTEEDAISEVYLVGAIIKVPEPITLLGSATALGFGSLFQRKKSKKNQKQA